MENEKEFLETAFRNVRELVPEYWQKALKQRLAEGGAGSVYHGFSSPEELERALLQAEWTMEDDSLPNPYYSEYHDVLFVTRDIPGGTYGMARIDDLPEGTLIYARDPKHINKVTLMVKGNPEQPTEETRLICGVRNGIMRVVTFFPGPMIPLIGKEVPPIKIGDVVTREEALQMGYHLAKLTVAIPDQ